MRTYLKLWWFARQATRWGRRLEEMERAVTVAETQMLHYQRAWKQLREGVVVYQTAQEREDGIRSAMNRMYMKPVVSPASDPQTLPDQRTP